MGARVSNSPLLDKGTYRQRDGTHHQSYWNRNGKFEPMCSPKTTKIVPLVVKEARKSKEGATSPPEETSNGLNGRRKENNYG